MAILIARAYIRSFALLTWLLASSSSAQQLLEISLPPGAVGVPEVVVRSLAVGGDGSLWLAETAAGKIAHLRSDGVLTEFSLPTPDSGPLGMATDLAGNVWFTEYYGMNIGRISCSGAFTEYPVHRAGSYPAGIVLGPDGAMWFSEHGGPDLPSVPTFAGVGRITATGGVTDFPLPLASPSLIAAGPPSYLTVLETRRSELGHVRTDGSLVTTSLAQGGTVFLATAPDGSIWASGQNQFYRIDSQLGISVIPSPGHQPFALTWAPDGSLWFTDVTRNQVVRQGPDGTIATFDLPTTDAFPSDIVAGPDGTIWVLEAKASKIARIGMPASPPRRIIPAVASSPGLNGTYFRTELSVFNPSPLQTTALSMHYYCRAAGCADRSQTVAVPPHSAIHFADILDELFDAPGTSGALEIWDPFGQPLSVIQSRVYTTTVDSATYGSAIPVQTTTDALHTSVFVGIPSVDPDLRSGFRTNAGAYNLTDTAALVTFTLLNSTGTRLGATTVRIDPHQGAQLSLASAFGSLASFDTGLLVATSTAPVLAYATVIDNRSGDSLFIQGAPYAGNLAPSQSKR